MKIAAENTASTSFPVNNDTNMQTSQYGGYLIFDVLDNKHEIPDISRSLTVMNSITKKQIGLFTRRKKNNYILHKERDRK